MSDDARQRKNYRDSVKSRFRKEGFQAFSDQELLELLLFYCFPRRDTAELADRLLKECGCFSNVFDRPIRSLEDFGLTFPVISLFKFIPAFCSRYYTELANKKTKNLPLVGLEDIKDVLFPHFIGKKEEHVLLLLMNRQHKQIYCDFVSKGTFVSSDINFQGILQLAAKYRAHSAVLAHNHPSGLAFPSQKDIAATIKIKNALSTLGVQLTNHFIFGDEDYCAMSSIAMFEDIFAC